MHCANPCTAGRARYWYLGSPTSRSLEHSAAQSTCLPVADSTSPPSVSLTCIHACSTLSMNPANPCNILAWNDRVDSTPQEMYACHIMITWTQRALTALVSSTLIPVTILLCTSATIGYALLQRKRKAAETLEQDKPAAAKIVPVAVETVCDGLGP
jgi:hypothetical protein